MTSRVCVYIATSLDGFIAGPDDELSWLPEADPEGDPDMEEEGGPETTTDDPDALDYYDFMDSVGALLMGRRTYDVVRGFDVAWPYGEKPVLVATTRPLDDDPPAAVRPVEGSIQALVDQAKAAAGGKNVYIDGGVLIRQAAEADLIDDLTISVAPVAIGAGLPLFAGMSRPYRLEIVSHHTLSYGMVQIRARPKRA